MDDDRNQDPGERMRSIFSSSEDKASKQFRPEIAPEPNQSVSPHSRSRSPLDQLPKLKPISQETPGVESKESSSEADTSTTAASRKRIPRDKTSEQSPVPSPVTQDQVVLPQHRTARSRRERALRALWTISSVFSLILNIVLMIILVVLYWAYRDIKLPENLNMSLLNNLLSGLHSNFEKMDRASINTVIPVEAQIPLNIIVPVRTTTQITLSESVNIPNAQVVINTGGLNINSTARVTLPAGTPLLVNLDFDLPVQDTIPIRLDVPVNIPMAETELHEPFVGLQEVIEPIYCFVDPGASNLDGQLICQ